MLLKEPLDYLKRTKFIYFEHHFDSMIIKNYKYSEIHDYLKIIIFTKF